MFVRFLTNKETISNFKSSQKSEFIQNENRSKIYNIITSKFSFASNAHDLIKSDFAETIRWPIMIRISKFFSKSFDPYF